MDPHGSLSSSGFRDTVEFVGTFPENGLQFGIGFTISIEHARILSTLLTGNQVGRVDQSTIMPADELGTGKGLPEKLLGPLGALLQGVGDRAVGASFSVSLGKFLLSRGSMSAFLIE